jgi:hypothetical protein
MRFVYFLAAAICAACGGRSKLVTLTGAVAPDASSATDAGEVAKPADAAGASCAWGFAPLAAYYNAGSAPASIAIADLDGDRHADLAVNNYGGGPTGMTLNPLRNNGDATFVPWQSSTSIVNGFLSRCQ